MTTEDFIIDLFCRIDDPMQDITKHSQCSLVAQINILAINDKRNCFP